jgi:hypothetical protein
VARALVDVACFFVEMAMLALLAVAGWRLGDGGLLGIALGVLYPALVVIVWARYIARTAEKRLGQPWRLLAQLLLVGGTTVAAAAADHMSLAIAFAVAGVVVFGLSALIGESELGPTRRAER